MSSELLITSQGVHADLSANNEHQNWTTEQRKKVSWSYEAGDTRMYCRKVE